MTAGLVLPTRAGQKSRTEYLARWDVQPGANSAGGAGSPCEPRRFGGGPATSFQSFVAGPTE